MFCHALISLLVFSSALPAAAQFTMQDSGTNADLRGIVNVGNGTAWASGTHGTVLRTEDSGFVWQGCAVPPGAEKLDFRGIQAFDDQTAIVMSSGKGDLSRVYKTTDGCATWKLVFTNPDAEGFFDAMQTSTRDVAHEGGEPHIWLLGDPVNGQFALFGSFDLGEHWHRVRQAGLAARASQGGAFAASNSLFILGYPLQFATAQGWLYGGGLENCTMGLVRAHMEQCLNGFRFSAEQLPMAHGSSSSGIFSIANWNEDLVAVGGDYSKPEETDGTAAFLAANPTVAVHGRSKQVTPSSQTKWLPAQTPPHGYRSSVAYDAQTKTWITVGPNGTDVSTDDGRNWRALKPGYGDDANADKQWNALSLPYVVGPHGRIGRLREDALAMSQSGSTPQKNPR
ncbi:WD40/YVTN/BNR-like repeat-containing protein [Terriglobus sp.]|uniref:WD40/YVTN/BNR-like repeat-containing protein n=1 Tax=Terriglobus sp. TaxID=1889013 RepID=UPI003B00AE22